MSGKIAIFTHYDKDDLIDDYVIYYLNALKEVVDKIIFVSDCNLSIEETKKINNIADKVICKKHGEYDFGSYKRGFLLALENNWLNDIEECIFTNDSCYGPFYSLKNVFETMQKKQCDFWGITENSIGLIKILQKYFPFPKKHLQSYFLVFKNNVFLSDIFIDFMKNIKPQNKKNDIIIKYEIELFNILVKAGFKACKFINSNFIFFNPTIFAWDKLILKHKMPFLKCCVLKSKNTKIQKNNYEKLIKRVSDYPVEIIYNNLNRITKS